MPVEEVEGSLLHVFAEEVFFVPYAGDKILGGMLAVPHLLHSGESILHAFKRKQLVLASAKEQGRLGTGDGGYMRIPRRTKA